ncbi:hypothetical protein [Faecalibacter macacae]|nr:hypothetical protein [Faecalibacter macacae]
MAKTKNLRGIPGNLALSYLSTLGYYENGYMADWLIRTFDKLNITQIKIDILNETIFPKEAQIKPLLSDIKKLKLILENELNKNEFEKGFIKNAEFHFEKIGEKTIKCNSFLEDINGKLYYPKKPIIEESYE